jgi:hypothetical protein
VKYRARITGWVGRLDGSAALLVDGEDVDPGDALVAERPDLVEPYDDEDQADVTAITDPEPRTVAGGRRGGRKTAR